MGCLQAQVYCGLICFLQKGKKNPQLIFVFLNFKEALRNCTPLVLILLLKQRGWRGEKEREWKMVDGWGQKEKERGGGREKKTKREEEVLWAPASSHCLSGVLITSHLPGQPGDGYVFSEHLLFEISVLALFLRKIST